MGTVVVPTFGADPVTITGPTLDAKVDGLATEFNGSIDNDNIKTAAAIANSKLNLASVAQNVTLAGTNVLSGATTISGALTVSNVATMSAKRFNTAKGADIASATTTTIWATDGNTYHITGTTTITGFGTATQAGALAIIVFDGILTLTHNATSLILPTGANITTAAGDTALVMAETTANARVIGYWRKDGTPLVAGTPTAATALSGSIIKTLSVNLTTPVEVTATFTNDDTPPLYSEGTEIGNSGSFTPSNASNTILIRASFWGDISSTQNVIYYITDGTTTTAALAVREDEGAGAAAAAFSGYIEHSVTAGSTDARTYYLLGGVSSGSLYAGKQAAADVFGAASFGNITIQEIKA